MAYTSQENAVENTFVKAQDQINKMQKVFRDEGLLAKAVVDIGGNQDFGAIQEAFDNLYGALEDAHYDAIAHIEVESVKQKLGMNKEPVAEIPTGDDVKEDDEEIQAIPAKVVELDLTKVGQPCDVLIDFVITIFGAIPKPCPTVALD